MDALTVLVGATSKPCFCVHGLSPPFTTSLARAATCPVILGAVLPPEPPTPHPDLGLASSVPLSPFSLWGLFLLPGESWSRLPPPAPLWSPPCILCSPMPCFPSTPWPLSNILSLAPAGRALGSWHWCHPRAGQVGKACEVAPSNVARQSWPPCPGSGSLWLHCCGLNELLV